MNIINLLLHDITITDEGGHVVKVVPRSMLVARLDTDRQLAKPSIGGILFWHTKYSIPYCARIDANGKEAERVNFPEQRPDTIYIVSGLFRTSYERSDLWQPGELIRDANGKPIGCVGLSQ